MGADELSDRDTMEEARDQEALTADVRGVVCSARRQRLSIIHVDPERKNALSKPSVLVSSGFSLQVLKSKYDDLPQSMQKAFWMEKLGSLSSPGPTTLCA